MGTEDVTKESDHGDTGSLDRYHTETPGIAIKMMIKRK